METLGRYQILGEIGRGGCGVVYAATDPRIGRKVAIKTIHANLDSGDGDAYRERLRREAHSAGVLSHANIVTIHEFDETGDMTYIVMEFVEGETLAERMKSQPLSVEFIISFVQQAAEALDFAHSQNIVHRDVKPGNFLITKSGLVKVADFGIAKAIGTDSDLTKTGTVVGTVHYMSPEQVASKNVTGQSDQFSLAVIAYEMTTGKKPFQGDSWASILHQIVTADPPPVKQYRASLGDPVTAVLRKGLAKDPKNRYPTCRQFAEEFNRALFNTTAERTVPGQVADAMTRPLPPPRESFPNTQTETEAYIGLTAPIDTSKQRPRAIPIAIALAATLALYGGWVAYRNSSTHPPAVAKLAPAVIEPKVIEPKTAEPPPEAPKTVPQEPAVTKAEKLLPKERKVVPVVPPPTKKEAAAATRPPVPVATAPEPAPAELSTPAPPPGKYRGPPEGRFSWTGTLVPAGRLTIAGNRASTGAINGRGLPPGLAVSVQSDPTAMQVVQQPTASNNFQLVLRNSGTVEVTAVNISWRENKD